MSLPSTRSWSPSTWLGATSSQGAPNDNDNDVDNNDYGDCGDDYGDCGDDDGDCGDDDDDCCDDDGDGDAKSWSLVETSSQGDPEDKDGDNGDDIYIMMKCLSVCVSRKMITSSWEFPVTT